MTASSTFRPGTILLNKYRVESLLGEGGMGVVLAAWHLALEERVAIKVLTHSASQHPEALARLQREARILARVRNPHVVRVIDLGQLDDGSPFMVMEHLTGRDLGSLLEQQGRFEPRYAVGLILQALVALAAAHASGVVHRDLKPANLFCVAQEGEVPLVKVLDFGISRLEGHDHGFSPPPMTLANTMMGTPLYMSPEQVRDPRAVDARSDIWSIGVVLYELLSGVSPFAGATLADIAVRITAEAPAPLSVANLPAGLGDVIARCLEKRPDRRYTDVGQLARALEPFAPPEAKPFVERAVRLVGGLASHSGPAEAPGNLPSLGAPAWRKRRATWLISLALLGGVLLLAWGWKKPGRDASLSRQDRPETARPPPQLPAALQPRAADTAESSGDREPLAPPESASAREPVMMPAKKPAATMGNPSFGKDPCKPPYTVDAQGRKRFKRECFIERSTL